ncbi:MAG: hypothetical protein HY901_23545 [Deltaproteobacteria bacterium]|nr:hypothetical protein [Deltaproteobacteria bacterium]
MLRSPCCRILLVSILVLAGCSEGSSSADKDASAGTDAAVDADSGLDAAVSGDAGADLGLDAAVDGGKLDPGTSWAKGVGGTSSDEGEAVAVDNQGNVYVTGIFSESLDFGDGARTSAGEMDVFVVSYDAAGALRWVKTFGGPNEDRGLALAVNHDTLVVAGCLESPLDIDGTALPNAGGEDVFIATFDLAGQLRRAKTFAGVDDARATAVAIDGAGNVAITGFFNGVADFGGKSLSSNNEFNIDLFVARYDSSGALSWAKSFGNGLYDRGRSVAFDHSGGVILSGEYAVAVNFGGGMRESAGQTDAVVVAFDVDGKYRWDVHWGGTGFDSAYTVAVDSDDSLVVIGQFSSDVDFGEGVITARGNWDAFFARLDRSGAQRWVKTLSSPEPDRGYGVAIDAEGNAYLTGSFNDTATVDGGGELTSSGYSDIYLVSYDRAGTLRRAERLGGAESDEGSSLAAGPSGEVLVTGYVSASFDGPTGEVLGAGGRDIVLWRVVP